MVSDIFVKKVGEKVGNIVTKAEITELWVRSGGSMTRIGYAMSILLGKKNIRKVANNLYIVTEQASHEDDIADIYWEIVAKLIKMHAPSGGVIAGEKALEFHLRNYSIPDILIIYTRDTALRIRLIDGREVHFRTLVSGPKTGKKNLWRILVDNSLFIDNPVQLQVCGRELALLESLSLRRHDTGIEEASIVRFLRSYHAQIDRNILGTLAKYRYIRPLNRLRVLARDLGYTDIYAMTLEIIRDEGGGCYLNL